MKHWRVLPLVVALLAVNVGSTDAQQGKPSEVHGTALQFNGGAAGSFQLLVSKIVPSPGSIPNSMTVDFNKQTRFEKVTVEDGKKKLQPAKAEDVQGREVIVLLKPGAKPVADKVTIQPEK